MHTTQAIQNQVPRHNPTKNAYFPTPNSPTAPTAVPAVNQSVHAPQSRQRQQNPNPNERLPAYNSRGLVVPIRCLFGCMLHQNEDFGKHLNYCLRVPEVQRGESIWVYCTVCREEKKFKVYRGTEGQRNPEIRGRFDASSMLRHYKESHDIRDKASLDRIKETCKAAVKLTGVRTGNVIGQPQPVIMEISPCYPVLSNGVLNMHRGLHPLATLQQNIRDQQLASLTQRAGVQNLSVPHLSQTLLAQQRACQSMYNSVVMHPSKHQQRMHPSKQQLLMHPSKKQQLMHASSQQQQQVGPQDHGRSQFSNHYLVKEMIRESMVGENQKQQGVPKTVKGESIQRHTSATGSYGTCSVPTAVPQGALQLNSGMPANYNSVQNQSVVRPTAPTERKHYSNPVKATLLNPPIQSQSQRTSKGPVPAITTNIRIRQPVVKMVSPNGSLSTPLPMQCSRKRSYNMFESSPGAVTVRRMRSRPAWNKTQRFRQSRDGPYSAQRQSPKQSDTSTSQKSNKRKVKISPGPKSSAASTKSSAVSTKSSAVLKKSAAVSKKSSAVSTKRSSNKKRNIRVRISNNHPKNSLHIRCPDKQRPGETLKFLIVSGKTKECILNKETIENFEMFIGQARFRVSQQQLAVSNKGLSRSAVDAEDVKCAKALLDMMSQKEKKVTKSNQSFRSGTLPKSKTSQGKSNTKTHSAKRQGCTWLRIQDLSNSIEIKAALHEPEETPVKVKKEGKE